MAYSTISKPSLHFNTKLYIGNGSTQHSITGVGFQPDWTWIKSRDDSYNHFVFDAVRGVGKQIYPNQNNAEATNMNNLYSFDTDGFSLAQSGNDDVTNKNNSNFASWNWKANGSGSANTDGSINSTVSANTTAGFSIVSYTGNGTSGATIGHGLGAVPKLIIIKQYSSNGGSENWGVYHHSLGNGKFLFLNINNSEMTSTGYWNNTTPTSSVFTLGNNDVVNNNTVSYIAYCFAEKSGYSKFGSYASNNTSGDGPFVYTGFAPALVITKISSTGGSHWRIFDNKRESYNGDRQYLQPDQAGTESNNDPSQMDLLSNGFKLRGAEGDSNYNTETVIYIAFAEEPLVANVGQSIPATAK